MQPDSQQIREGSAASGTPLFLYALEQSFQRVGGDAHIAPLGIIAIRIGFSKISNEFVYCPWVDVGIDPYEKEGALMCAIAPSEEK